MRVPFDPSWHVTPPELERLVEAARWAPTAHNMQNFELVVVDDVAVLADLGAIRSPVSPAFIVENYRQLSSSPEELARRQTGLLATMFPVSWRTGDPAQAQSSESRLLGDVIAGAPMVMIVLFDERQRAPASEHDRLGMLSLGCVLENVWLTAHALHLDLQVVSSFSGDPVEDEVKRVLAVPAPWRIAYGLRLGHAVAHAAQAPRIRRDPQRFVHRNRFAK